jgi:hypothetical protein
MKEIERGEGERGVSRRERERERDVCDGEVFFGGRDKSLILLKKVCRRGEKSRTKGDLPPFIPRCNKGGHISPCDGILVNKCK